MKRYFDTSWFQFHNQVMFWQSIYTYTSLSCIPILSYCIRTKVGGGGKKCIIFGTYYDSCTYKTTCFHHYAANINKFIIQLPSEEENLLWDVTGCPLHQTTLTVTRDLWKCVLTYGEMNKPGSGEFVFDYLNRRLWTLTIDIPVLQQPHEHVVVQFRKFTWIHHEISSDIYCVFI